MKWSEKLARTVFYQLFMIEGRELPQSAEFLPYQLVKDHLNIDKE